jgi:hypothetical protein
MALSHTEEWVITKNWLIDQGQEGREAIQGALKELESFGYLIRELKNDEKGRFDSIWTFFATPQDQQVPEDHGRETVYGKPSTVNRARETVDGNQHIQKTISEDQDQKTKTEQETQPSARVNFVARWCESFEKRFGLKYKVTGPDLGAIRTERLGSSEESKVEKLINDAVKIWDRPGWLSKRCVTIQGFLASQNQVGVELQTPLKGELKEMKDPTFKIKIAQF